MTEVEALRTRMTTQGSQVARLQAENDALRAALSNMEAEKRQWQIEKASQSAIIAQRLMTMNAEKVDMAQEIEVLKATIRPLAGDT